MGSIRYFLGRTLQLIGLATISVVVFMLTWSLIGASEFYGGTWLMGKEEG